MLLNPNKKKLETEHLETGNLQSEDGKAMINKDGTLNFNYFSKKSQIKNSQYQREPKLENLLTNQNILESETKKETKLNFYYGKKIERSEKSIRGTITKDARTTHLGSGNIVGKFMKEGNANLLLDGISRERAVGTGRKEDSNGFGFARRKEETSLVKHSTYSKSKYISMYY
jgi:hypothetical protein